MSRKSGCPARVALAPALAHRASPLGARATARRTAPALGLGKVSLYSTERSTALWPILTTHTTPEVGASQVSLPRIYSCVSVRASARALCAPLSRSQPSSQPVSVFHRSSRTNMYMRQIARATNARHDHCIRSRQRKGASHDGTATETLERNSQAPPHCGAERVGTKCERA